MIPFLPENQDLLGQLGHRLRDDKNGVVLAEYCGCFEATLLEAKKKFHQPLLQEEFDMNQAIAGATTVAVEVVTAVWNAMHNRL